MIAVQNEVRTLNKINKSSGATALHGFGRQSGHRRSAKLVQTFADRGLSRGQRNGSPRPLISVYRTWIFVQLESQKFTMLKYMAYGVWLS